MVISVLLCFSIVSSAKAASMWSRTYGGAADEKAYSLVATSDGGYAIAGVWNYSYYSDWVGYLEGGGFWLLKMSGDFWLVKIDEFGDMKWNRTYKGTGVSNAFALVATSDGGYAIAGATAISGGAIWSTKADAFFNGDFWLIKTDAFGNTEWNKTYGTDRVEIAYSLAAASDGGYAIAGRADSNFWLVKTDEFGNMLWNRTYGGTGDNYVNSLVATSDGGYAIAGSTQSAGSSDFWLVKTDALGNMQWNRTYGGIGSDWANSLIVAPEGGYIMAGFTTNSLGFGAYWLVKTDEGGNMQWNKTYEGFGGEACSVVATPDGGYAIVGGSDYVWLLKTDEFGNLEWWERYGGGGFNVAFSAIVTSDGGYAIAGATDFFGGTHSEGFDCWVIKTDEFGMVPEYSSWIVPALVLTATAFLIIKAERKRRRALT